MTEISVRRYDPSLADSWNEFVRRSKNGTFLFDRSFMEYHRDRFADHSLVAIGDGRLLALLPANEFGDTVISHGGLTYGGFVTDLRMRADLMLEVLDAVLDYTRRAGFARLLYKPVPHFYHRLPAEEDAYALFHAGARQVRIDAASAIRMRGRPALSKSKKQGVKAARKAGVAVRESMDWAACWHILETVLETRHDTRPTHSLGEIQSLAALFPSRIRLFGAFAGTEMISALVIFDCVQTVHVQYIASAPAGREVGGVDIIVDHLLNEVFHECEWFDFGISTVDQGRVLNAGLSRQKEMFGARTVIYQQLEIEV